MVRILTQDCDPVVTRKAGLPPAVCAIVDACLKRERDERTSNAGVLARQMEGALREMRAMRFRALGRRNTDRGSAGPHDSQQRVTDLDGASTSPKPLTRASWPSQRNLLLAAAGVGAAIGALALLLILIILRR
jgi:serine/threonine-protein kinase